MLISGRRNGLQKQLNGLLTYCATNLMIANELKTKYMVFGSKTKCELYFDGKLMERVDDYNNLGIIISQTTNISGDIFANNCSYSCSKVRSSVYAMKCKLSKLGKLNGPEWPHIYFLPSTSNHMMWGELGITPLSVKCCIKIRCCYDRLISLPDDRLLKRAYNEALKLQEQDFTTWVSKVWDIVNKY